jgi:adenylate cyclase
MVALAAVRHGRLAETPNLLLHDLALQWRSLPSAAPLPIRIIAIEEEDLRQLGWPLEDQVLVAAIQRLERAGARAIALGLYRDLGVGRGQRELRRLAAAPGALISTYSLIDRVGPIPGTPPERQAYNDLLVDADGVVRRDLVHVRGQGPAGVALPMRLLEHWRRQSISPLRARLEADPRALDALEPRSGGYSDLDHSGLQRLLAYHRPGSFQSWSLRALLAGQVPAERLRGTVVLIGSRSPSLRDAIPVPFGRQPWAQTSQRMAAVDIHAHRVAALLALERGQRVGLTAASGTLNGLVLFVAIALGALLGEGLGSLRHSLLAVALAAGAALAGGWASLVWGGVWINIALPLAGLIAMATAAWTSRGIEQQQQQRQLQRLLGQTISTSVARELWNQRDALLVADRFRAREIFVTVLIADIVHFTSVAETMPPEPLLRWLNQAMEQLVVAVQGQGGLVNKFTGDGVLAVFGAPLSQGQGADATAALQAAVAIRQAMRGLNEGFLREGLPQLRLRLGLHSGWVLAGSIGGRERWEYGVIGDTVNCAARIDGLPGLGPAGDCRILLSGVTRSLLTAESWPGGLWRSWGSLSLNGRSRREDIWELVDPHDPETLA